MARRKDREWTEYEELQGRMITGPMSSIQGPWRDLADAAGGFSALADELGLKARSSLYKWVKGIQTPNGPSKAIIANVAAKYSLPNPLLAQPPLPKNVGERKTVKK